MHARVMQSPQAPPVGVVGDVPTLASWPARWCCTALDPTPQCRPDCSHVSCAPARTHAQVQYRLRDVAPPPGHPFCRRNTDGWANLYPPPPNMHGNLDTILASFRKFRVFLCLRPRPCIKAPLRHFRVFLSHFGPPLLPPCMLCPWLARCLVPVVTGC